MTARGKTVTLRFRVAMELEDSGLEFVVDIEPEPITVLVGRYRVD